MNVAEFISVLEKIEDKSLPVCIADWSEQYASDILLTSNENSISIVRGKYAVNGDEVSGEYLLITP